MTNSTFRATNWNIQQGILDVTTDGALGTGNSVVLLGGRELLTDAVGYLATRTVNLHGNGGLAAVTGTTATFNGSTRI